jgi:type II secretory pathway component HofQ
MKRFVILALACAFAPVAMAQLYKYVDQDGKTVYSDQPPANSDSRQLNIQSGGSTAIAPAKTAVDRDKELQKARDKVRDDAKKSDVAVKKAQADAERCQVAKSAFQQYADGGRIHKYVNGERVYLGDDEIAVEKERAQRQMDELCKKG